MSNLNLPYQSPEDRELDGTPKPTLRLTPFNVQRIVFNLIKLHWMNNDPAKVGYTFQQRYNPVDSNSDIYIDLALNKKLNPLNKRPAIIVSRSDANFGSPVMGQRIDVDEKEARETKLHITTMGLSISCIAEPVGFVEQLTEWTAQPLLDFEAQIRGDYGFRRFRMALITRPSEYKEAKDNFLCNIQIEAVWDDQVVITQDSLKLKTISSEIFLQMTNQPLEDQ